MPLQPFQPFQKTQLQPPVGPSADSLCHPWFTTTNLSYRFRIFETSALCSTTVTYIVWYIYICVCACISYIIFGVYASKQYVYSAYVYITQLYVIWCCMYICIQSVTEKIHLDSKTLSRTAGLRGRMGQPIQIRNKRPMCRRQCPEINSRIGPRKNIWPKECSGLSLQWLDYCRTKTIRVPNLEQLRSC